jgi:hypothetical protein
LHDEPRDDRSRQRLLYLRARTDRLRRRELRPQRASIAIVLRFVARLQRQQVGTTVRSFGDRLLDLARVECRQVGAADQRPLGQGAMGEARVTRCLEIIHNELDIAMAFCGHRTIRGVSKDTSRLAVASPHIASAFAIAGRVAK